MTPHEGSALTLPAPADRPDRTRTRDAVHDDPDRPTRGPTRREHRRGTDTLLGGGFA